MYQVAELVARVERSSCWLLLVMRFHLPKAAKLSESRKWRKGGSQMPKQP